MLYACGAIVQRKRLGPNLIFTPTFVAPLYTSVPVNPNRRRPSVNLQPSSAAALSSLLSVNRSLRHRSIALLALSMSQSASTLRCLRQPQGLVLLLPPLPLPLPNSV
ncbi:hypothetical protein PIB30_093732 [Stylosanthes scabra]|uniref:Uncharacterized protein n=1 Tax=Stylosanthes scabra TaxID=79078 RepID=A0ABU6WYH2_9FABA|nr:hypothetical protein [Stylosanthes scabra]